MLGAPNVSFPSENSIVDSAFNSWLTRKRLIFANEIYCGHSRRPYDRLKTYMTDEVVEVNEKGVPQYPMENWAHFIACSNSDAALHLDNEDRRWLVPTVRDHGKIAVKEDGFSFHLCQLRPESRGRIALASSDPVADPLIFANYLESDVDRRVMRECVRIGRDVAAQAALDPYRGDELSPGPEVKTDDQIDAWIRQNAETIYHPVGTCKMGTANDRLAVVDERLRVRGLDGLRVADASVMPTLVGSNTNAATIMIAEKAAHMIRTRESAPA